MSMQEETISLLAESNGHPNKQKQLMQQQHNSR